MKVYEMLAEAWAPREWDVHSREITQAAYEEGFREARRMCAELIQGVYLPKYSDLLDPKLARVQKAQAVFDQTLCRNVGEQELLDGKDS